MGSNIHDNFPYQSCKTVIIYVGHMIALSTTFECSMVDWWLASELNDTYVNKVSIDLTTPLCHEVI